MRFATVCLFSAALTAVAPAFAQAPGSEPDGQPAGSSQGLDEAVAAPASIDALLDGFAAMPGLEAEFVEEKSIGLLAAPLVSRGRLYFAPPGLLARRVEDPTPSSVVVTPDSVRATDASGTVEIALGARPELRALVESMVWLLAGDAASLRSAYALALEAADGGRWTLTMTPLAEPLTHLIAHMQIEGIGPRVAEVRVVETTGDATVTRIVAADPWRTFSDAERAELFGPSNP